MESTEQAKESVPKENQVEDLPNKQELDRSFESMGSQEQEEPHYNLDSDGEPPHDEVGDTVTVVQKR